MRKIFQKVPQNSIDFQIENTIISQLSVAIAIFDKNLCYMDASEKWISDYHLNKVQIIGKSHYEIFPEIGEEWKAIHRECLKGVIKRNDEDKFERADGSIQWLKWEVKPWYTKYKEVGGLIMLSEDITEQKNGELLLEESRNLLLEASKVSKVGAWEYDVIEKKLQWSSVTKEIHEVPENYIPDLSTGINFYLVGENRKLISEAFIKLLEKGIPYNIELKIRTFKGNIKWVRAIGKANFKKGKCIRVYGTFQDINDNKLLEEKLSQERKLLNSIIDNIPISVYFKDKNLKKVLINKTEYNYMKKNGDLDALSKSDKNNPDIIKILNEEKRVIETGIPIINQVTNITNKDGSENIFYTSKIPLKNDENNTTGIIGIHYDVTDIKRRKKELENLIKITNKQNERLLNFAHIVSHNLRSHSTNISALLKLYNKEKNKEIKDEMFNMINNASNNLNATIANLNEVVAINNNIHENKVTLSLLDEVNKTLINVQAQIKDKDATMHVDVPASIYIKSIPAYIESILLNLITNSLKYSSHLRKPIVKISAKKTNDEIEISVKDNGIGIDLDMNSEKLFGMYKTFHGNEDARGIGLFITKNQVEALNGEITVLSELNKGTEFRIKFYEKN